MTLSAPTVSLDLKYRSGQFREAQSRTVPIHLGNNVNMRQILHRAVDEFCDDLAFPETKAPETPKINNWGMTSDARLSE